MEHLDEHQNEGLEPQKSEENTSAASENSFEKLEEIKQKISDPKSSFDIHKFLNDVLNGKKIEIDGESFNAEKYQDEFFEGLDIYKKLSESKINKEQFQEYSNILVQLAFKTGGFIKLMANNATKNGVYLSDIETYKVNPNLRAKFQEFINLLKENSEIKSIANVSASKAQITTSIGNLLKKEDIGNDMLQFAESYVNVGQTQQAIQIYKGIMNDFEADSVKNSSGLFPEINQVDTRSKSEIEIFEKAKKQYQQLSEKKAPEANLVHVDNNEQAKKLAEEVYIKEQEIMDNNTEDISFKSRIDLTELSNGIALIKGEIGKVIVGQKEMIDMLIASILANGHSLIEGVPGVAKTISAKLLAKSLEIDFSRIQFTPDLMPSDILGTSVFNIKTSEFEFKEGPIFSNMILIDEINRAPAKTQAALFEVMEERQITIDGHKFKMDLPFIVLATQNPVEQEGTYRLPEAQLDRFLFKIDIDYPNLDEEIEILNREQNLKGNEKTDQITAHLSKAQISKFQNLVEQILIESHLLKYIADIIVSTRSNPFLYLGASPRASIAILRASKAFAAMSGRDFVTPEDIKRAAIPVLQHRVIVTPEREMEGVTTKQIIKQIIEAVEIHR
jgi:MoxR-like ATPase